MSAPIILRPFEVTWYRLDPATFLPLTFLQEHTLSISAMVDHWFPCGRLSAIIVVYGAGHFELFRMIDGCFYSEDAAFVIHLDTVGLTLELHPAANGTFFIVGDCLSLKPRVRFAPHKGENIGAIKIVECVTNQRRIDILWKTLFRKHDIGCELALIHTPVAALPESIHDSIEEGIDGFGKSVETPAEPGGIKFTYSDLVQTGIFIVALIGLCYTIFKGKTKIAATTRNSDGWPCKRLMLNIY